MGVPRPHELVATVPAEQLVDALVRNLAEAVGGQAAYGLPSGDDLAVVASWPARSPWYSGVPAEGVVREPVAGGGVVLLVGPKRWDDGLHAVVRETVAWLGLAARLDELRADRARAQARAGRLRAEVTAARERLAQVRDLERRRLVNAITTTTLRELDAVRGRLRALPAGGAIGGELAAVREVLGDLIDNFRTVVRGVYPSILPDRGPRVALEELAAMLPRPVRFGGDLGRRVGWQVESGLYHAVAAVLNVLAGLRGEGPIQVAFDRDDTLRVRITADGGGVAEQKLRTALGHDVLRLAVLGGEMTCAVVDGSAVVTVRLAEQIERVVAPETAEPPVERSALYQRVRDLVRLGQQTAGPARARWDALAARMASPVRLAVVGDWMPQAVRGVEVITARGPADRALAEEFLADDGPRGAIDAVVCLVPPQPAFRAALRSGSRRVTLTESASVDDLAGKLVGWQAMVAARHAMATATELMRGIPPDHPLRWAVDRTSALAHEIVQFDLLDDLEHGDPRLLRGVAGDAARLLGAHGTDARSRLGLAGDVGEGEVRAMAQREAARWWAHAQRPATGGRDRMACEVLARTAEGLLTAERVP